MACVLTHWLQISERLQISEYFLYPEGCPNGLGEHSALLSQVGVFSENKKGRTIFIVVSEHWFAHDNAVSPV
jgi:hypothetical protein